MLVIFRNASITDSRISLRLNNACASAEQSTPTVDLMKQESSMILLFHRMAEPMFCLGSWSSGGNNPVCPVHYWASWLMPGLDTNALKSWSLIPIHSVISFTL